MTHLDGLGMESVSSVWAAHGPTGHRPQGGPGRVPARAPRADGGPQPLALVPPRRCWAVLLCLLLVSGTVHTDSWRPLLGWAQLYHLVAGARPRAPRPWCPSHGRRI